MVGKSTGRDKSRTDSTSFGQNQNYKKYDTFVGVCIGKKVS